MLAMKIDAIARAVIASQSRSDPGCSSPFVIDLRSRDYDASKTRLRSPAAEVRVLQIDKAILIKQSDPRHDVLVDQHAASRDPIGFNNAFCFCRILLKMSEIHVSPPTEFAP